MNVIHKKCFQTDFLASLCTQKTLPKYNVYQNECNIIQAAGIERLLSILNSVVGFEKAGTRT